ncbi:MAG TPA: hypothetical protein VFC07_13825 [Verrucomicrobiae bacterium]|nr:hypothetical protein [Verrucomicrobiae bacterium]
MKLNAKMDSAGFNPKLGARRVWAGFRKYTRNAFSKIFAAIIIVIVAAAAKAAAKNILPSAPCGPEGRVAVNATRVFGALEQVGTAPAIVNGTFYDRPKVIIAGQLMNSIGVGGIAAGRRLANTCAG